MTSAATAMALVRGLHLATTLSLLGTAGFIAWILPAGGVAPDTLHRRLVRLWWTSGSVALLAGLAWFTLQSAAIAGADDVSDLLDALPVVAEHTRFGTTLMLRLALLLVATLAGVSQSVIAVTGLSYPIRNHSPARVTVYLTLLLAAIALGLQGVIGHAGAAAGAIGDGLVLSESLHLLAAGLWLGALLPLWISLPMLPPAPAALVCERFSPVGLACVLVLAGTGFAQALQLIGGLPALLGTTYGHIALLKIALFLLALTLAAVNRLWLTDRLRTGEPVARRHLMVSVVIETILGLAIITAAAFLASTVPGAHQAPVWPFSWQFSLITVREDPDFRQEVCVSLLAIGAGILILAAALLWRRFRLPALVALLALLAWRGPSLSLLTAEAYPTSFQTSPTGFSAASIAHGQALFMQNCVACHGPDGEGDGPVAAGLDIKPADLTQPHVLEHTDGEMFWWLTHGMDDPKGGLAMPGFANALSADDRWALVDYVRAHSAGVAMQQDPPLDVPVRAPALPILCNGLPASTMADLRGHAVFVVLADVATDLAAVPAQDAITFNVSAETEPAGDGSATKASAADTKLTPGSCVATDPTAWNAYAVLADLPLDEAAGAEFLVDPNGWLRAAQRPGVASGWHSRDDLLAAIRGIRAHPIEQPNGGSHEHHH
jgi:putative copper export protein/mono/diheme cytochrome c family protein